MVGLDLFGCSHAPIILLESDLNVMEIAEVMLNCLHRLCQNENTALISNETDLADIQLAGNGYINPLYISSKMEPYLLNNLVTIRP